MAAILAKRKKGAPVLPVEQFEELCGKLEKKYGEAPVDAWRSAQQKEQEKATPSDQMDTSSEAGQIDVLSAFYAKFDPAKVRTATSTCNA
eukprot:COSAG02_NODE_36702_length_451_cov_1.514205_1_plen_90_part_00